MSKRLPRGSVSPCVVTFDANHDTSEPVGLRWDPLDVTAVSINVRRPDGATDTWSASISATTTSSLTALHVLETPGSTSRRLEPVSADLTRPALTRLRPDLLLPGRGVPILCGRS